MKNYGHTPNPTRSLFPPPSHRLNDWHFVGAVKLGTHDRVCFGVGVSNGLVRKKQPKI